MAGGLEKKCSLSSWQVEEIRDNIDRIQGCVEEVKRKHHYYIIKIIIIITMNNYYNVQYLHRLRGNTAPFSPRPRLTKVRNCLQKNVVLFFSKPTLNSVLNVLTA